MCDTGDTVGDAGDTGDTNRPLPVVIGEKRRREVKQQDYTDDLRTCPRKTKRRRFYMYIYMYVCTCI